MRERNAAWDFPKLGPCHCINTSLLQRQNCRDCYGTGQRIDFAALQAADKERERLRKRGGK